MKSAIDLWVEKYRPKELDEFIGNEHIKYKFKEWIEAGQIPHLLFYGNAGTGKTSAAKLLADKIGAEKMYINCSDENDVDTVRSKIKHFAYTRGFKNRKVAICDEFDFMSINAQAALRNIIEESSENCRFIFTCNYIKKINDAIKSRCISFDVKPPKRSEVALKLSQIMENEGIKYDKEDVVHLVKVHYPDVRKAINECQSLCRNGRLVIDKNAIGKMSYMDDIIDLMESSGSVDDFFEKARKRIIRAGVYQFDDFYRYLYNNINSYAPKGKRAMCLIHISDALKYDSDVVDKEINLMNGLIEIYKTLKG